MEGKGVEARPKINQVASIAGLPFKIHKQRYMLRTIHKKGQADRQTDEQTTGENDNVKVCKQEEGFYIEGKGVEARPKISHIASSGLPLHNKIHKQRYMLKTTKKGTGRQTDRRTNYRRK